MKQNRLERLDYLFKKIDRAYRNFDAALDLPHSAVSVYYCLLNQEGSCELGALRAETGVPKQTLNSLLRQLEKEGMLEVRLAEGSHKKKAAILTEKGRKQAENTAGLVMECEKRALASFDEKKRSCCSICSNASGANWTLSLMSSSRKGRDAAMNDFSQNFTIGKTLKFTIPTILTMIFGSIYGIVDGIFISTFVSKTAFAAVNFVMPVLMILGTIGMMFGTGGSALAGKLMGEQQEERARQVFSLLTWVLIVLSLALSVLGYLFLPQILGALGAKDAMLEQALVYGRINLLGLTFFTLQYFFQAMMITAGKPKLNFLVTLSAGMTNMVLDYVFIALFDWQAPGAALATIIGQMVGGLVPLLMFLLRKKGLLYLVPPLWNGQ